MKKLYLITSIILLIQAVSFAAGVEPRWDEFCPSEFVDAETDIVPNQADNTGAFMVGMLFPPAAIPMLLRNKKKNEGRTYALERNYWAGRRKSFDAGIEQCRASETDSTNCFMQLRQIEATKTSNHDMQLQLTQMNKEMRRIRANMD